MTYVRKELYLIKDVDFNLSNPKKKASAPKVIPKPQNKFLIVIDVVNHDMGIYCYTCSLRGDIAKLVVPKIVNECNKLDDGHFYKFGGNDISTSYTFEVQTYLKGIPGDVFEESVATLYQKYNKADKVEKKGVLKDEVFIALLECLKTSDFLDGNLLEKIEKIHAEELKILAAAKKKTGSS